MSAAETRSPIDDIRKALGGMTSQFQAVLPTREHVDRFIRVVMTAIQDNPKLLEADRMSLYAACMQCATDGLLPDGKEAHLNIYNTNVGSRDKPDWRAIVEYEPMVEGMMKKLRNSGETIGAPKVHVVRRADEFLYELGDNERIVHKPLIGERGNVIAAYSIVKLKSGDTSREVMGIDEIMQVRARSKSKDTGPWAIPENGNHTSNFGEQCRKTVFRRHTKKLPKSTDLDNVLKSFDKTFVPFDNKQAAGAPTTSLAALPAPGQAGGEPMPQMRSDALNKIVQAAGAEPVKAEPKAEQRPVPVDDGVARDIL